MCLTEIPFALVSDAKKALKDCFPRHCCHPKMAMVLDDRLPVWEKTDQPRVHEVQAFMPYTDPKGEVRLDYILFFTCTNHAFNSSSSSSFPFLFETNIFIQQSMKELPPLCIARNIACNVRGYFFK